ncbi:hypothetical protein SLEP1_g503 [Rubroshorea leprosula]|uniref:Lipoxygenase n=1 Tax=Rubroshorea leprosula TaxID=152421 RepID=A0AAV5HFG4_9ROSI|nr:hypothetical protein SLEP1_g503 [Rubroshorea leprosula]
MEQYGRCSRVGKCVGAVKSKIFRANSDNRCIIEGTIVIEHGSRKYGPGKSVSVQIYSSTEVDPDTGKGKLSQKAYLKEGKSSKQDDVRTTTYQVKFFVESGFGVPGAFVVRNQHRHEFFLQHATLQASENQIIHFDCRSWVYPIKKTKSNRIFFSNSCFLPSQTPRGLVELRREELVSLRGNGTGERKKWDRIYEYDYYNDLGNPDEDPEYIRPVLGGSNLHPFPRRLRTGRPPNKTDPSTESRPELFNFDIYVPPDERFSPKKLAEFKRNAIQATLHFLVPEAKKLFQESNGLDFESFDEILDLFSSNRDQVLEGGVAKIMKKLVTDGFFKEITNASKLDSINFPLPQIIAANDTAWIEDEEFGHQMLAGANPTRIRGLETFPPEGSSIDQSHIEHNLDGLSLERAMKQWRLYILDHHDYLMPFLERIFLEEGACTYASRTLFFLRNDATLKPVAIELSFPGVISRVFVPASEGTDRALWQLAKAHVAANDSVYHQLINHWLHTHMVAEPFIIATRRQLSVMHPIHRLLDPHFKDTMHINALARSFLINAGGIFDNTLFSGSCSMELSSELYKEWRFDEQALSIDLLNRRMALEDTQSFSEVFILFQDYPYGLDGLDIWVAIKAWVQDFCDIFYKDDDSVRSDVEIQAWWSEIRNVGHGDKRQETWWYEMTTRSELMQALTTLIWIASGLHASLNFGQYAYAGYPPSRPFLCRKFIPYEGTEEFAEFLSDPDNYFLQMLPGRIQMTLGIALLEVLSRHISDEEYLGQRPSSKWIDNKDAQEKFEKFNENLKEVEKKILERNEDPKLKNRWGKANIPYRLLYPDTSKVEFKGGITSRGIPNSISI